MGRYSYSNRQYADNLRKIEMSWLKKEGYIYNNYSYQSGSITWKRSSSKVINSIGVAVTTEDNRKEMRIYYTLTDNHTGAQKYIDYIVPIVSTPCHFGGVRYWFICSLYREGAYCGRRVANLYNGGDYYACRHCYDLTYKSKATNRRSDWYSSMVALDLYDKATKLSESMRSQFYRGKPTRRMKRLMKLYRRVSPMIKRAKYS